MDLIVIGYVFNFKEILKFLEVCWDLVMIIGSDVVFLDVECVVKKYVGE